MCGRVRLSSDYSEIKIKLKFDLDAPAPNFEREWNLPPTRPMLVAIRSQDGKRLPKMMRWRLLPHWAKDKKISCSTFNARSEEFTTKPAFRDVWKRGQRCLVVMDGFYEWNLADADWSKWLGEELVNETELLQLLKPSRDEALKIWSVDKCVGNVRNKGANLSLPVRSTSINNSTGASLTKFTQGPGSAKRTS
jgi:putative SOS response-associated peptidase YedK